MKISLLLVLAIAGGLSVSMTRTSSELSFKKYHGAADASALEVLDTHWIVIADDEDNLLRIYHREEQEAPIRSIDLGPFLRADGKGSEVDLEGSARIGDTLFWISSHGRNASGKVAETRHRLLATKVGVIAGVPWIHPVGSSYIDLVADLIKDPRFASLNLREASQRAPKDPGGFNIEGLVATPSGGLLIGFRNPVPEGKALVIPLLNPFEVVAGRPPLFGEALHLPLGGNGIRGMTRSQGEYWILAGPVTSSGDVQLYRWADGTPAPQPFSSVDLHGFNAEGIAVSTTEGQNLTLVLVSDDGTQRVGGREAKRLKDARLKTFRVATVEIKQADHAPTPSPASFTDGGGKSLALSQSQP